MPLFPIVLIIISCFTHAGWNLLARHRRDEVRFIRRMLLLIVPLTAVPIAAGLMLPHSFPPRIWAYLVPSGLICGAYFFFLARAYGSSDFTIVYPVARALPVLMVAGVDVLRGRYPTGAGWVGMLVVVAGCVVAPQESLREFDLRRYHLREVGWILLTAATIVGFTMFDKLAQEMVQRGPGSALLYCGVWHNFACAGYLFLHAVVPAGSGGEADSGWGMPAAAAVLGLISYTLVLWAYQLTSRTGYLLAFRQFSIAVGVAASFILHREAGARVRLPATAAIVAGLVVLAVWG
ncbi:MAG: hypothetical protein ACOC7T_03325 [Planctomycetota bacterium]